MNLAAKLLEMESDLATQMTALYEGLPGSISGGGELDPRYLERALLEPARDIMGRTGKGLRARVMEHCWFLAGGDAAGPPEVLPVLIELLHAGSLVIDDIEDDSPTRRGEPALHRRYGLPVALNTGNWLYFLPLALLSRSNLAPELRLSVYEDLSTALVRCHQGQSLDISVKVAELQQSEVPLVVERATRLKTGSLMELAAIMGARAAGAEAAEVTALSKFGMEFGVALQMLDDWSGVTNETRRHKGVEDVRLGRPTWVWGWLAEICDEVSFAEILRDQQGISIDWEAEQIISRIRSRLGAIPGARIASQIAEALDSLTATLGDSPELRSLREDAAGLVRAYV